MEPRYRGYRRCTRIDYANSNNVFEVTICVKPKRVVFDNERLNQIIVNELKALQEIGSVGVYVYCIMPDHIHLIVHPGSCGLSEAMRCFKARVSKWWNEYGDGKPLWQRSYFDHCIRDGEGFQEKCMYVLQNPVRAGLARSTSEYPWCGSMTRR